MSAGTHAYVSCDYLDMAAPPGQRACREHVEEGWTKTEGRRAAKRLGWTVGVHAKSTRRGGDFDYCPAHRPLTVTIDTAAIPISVVGRPASVNGLATMTRACCCDDPA